MKPAIGQITTPAPHTHHLRVLRTARYYTLGNTAAPQQIWFALHGYGQLAGDFIRYVSDLAGAERLVVAPEAMNRFYLVQPEKAPARDRPVGATWMTREDRESEIADYVEYLDALYDEVAGAHAANGARVHVLGFSQATATAARWVGHGRARIDRLILWGGALPPETRLAGATTLRGVPVTYVVGTRDQYITAEALDGERTRLNAAGVSYRLITYDGGHAISRAVLRQLTDDDV